MKFLALIFTLLVMVIPAHAGPSDELQKLGPRPTVADVLEAYGGKVPDENPLSSYLNEDRARFYRQNLAKVIAGFETAFPGGVYAGLGRDTSLLTDALDAFYTQQGHPGRAVRIDLSGDSVRPTAHHLLANYFYQLKLNGVDLKNLSRSRSLVIFDRTGYAYNSQSRRIMTALYGNLLKRGVDVATLVRKVNFISTADTYYKAHHADQYFRFVSADANGPNTIMSIPEAGDLTDASERHGSFGRMKRKFFTRELYAARGSSMSQLSRRSALAEIIFVIQLTSSPEFLRQVQDEARKLGTEINLEPQEETLVETESVLPAASMTSRAVRACSLLLLLGL